MQPRTHRSAAGALALATAVLAAAAVLAAVLVPCRNAGGFDATALSVVTLVIATGVSTACATGLALSRRSRVLGGLAAAGAAVSIAFVTWIAAVVAGLYHCGIE